MNRLLSKGKWLLVLAATGACSQVLGIEDAHLDAAIGGGSGGTDASPSAENGGNDGSESGGSAGSVNVTNGGGGSGGSNANTAGSQTAGGTLGAGGDTSLPVNVCEQYCDLVMTNCKGEYEQYRTFDQCVEVCKRLPPGSEGAEDENSIGCRVRQAELAESEPFVYCKSAGPLGNGKCSSNCISYCSLMQSTCTVASTAGNVELSYFQDTQACLSACGEFSLAEGDPEEYSSSATADPSSFVGNHIFCRTYHLAAAIEQDTPDEHCPHAMGGDPCIVQ